MKDDRPPITAEAHHVLELPFSIATATVGPVPKSPDDDPPSDRWGKRLDLLSKIVTLAKVSYDLAKEIWSLFPRIVLPDMRIRRHNPA